MGDETPGGALATQSGYFEFIEESAWEKGGRETRTAWELEDGRRYYIVMTTSAGLYRYLLGDIVEVCGFHHATPRIRFVRKGGAACNLLGEKLEEVHLNQAVGKALEPAGLEASFFCLAPRLGGDRPGYALYLETRAAVPPAFGAAADALLGEASFDYARLRGANQLAPIHVQVLPPGSYDAFRQARVSEGSAEAQLKTAHLVADPAALPFSPS